jgi:hypothetical protein
MVVFGFLFALFEMLQPEKLALSWLSGPSIVDGKCRVLLGVAAWLTVFMAEGMGARVSGRAIKQLEYARCAAGVLVTIWPICHVACHGRTGYRLRAWQHAGAVCQFPQGWHGRIWKMMKP